MTTDSQRRAAALRADLDEVTTLTLPQPPAAVTPLAEADPVRAAAIRQRMAQIDLASSGSIVRFGSAAQAGLQEISQKMLADVRSKDTGPAGDSLRGIVGALRGFSTAELDLRRERSWWERLVGRAAPFAKFVASYEQVQGQIDRITTDLETHEQRLLVDIKALDVLYDRTLAFYDELALYIAAGEAKLAEIDARDIPAAEAALAGRPEAEAVLAAQQLRDLRAARDDLDRRVHDLRLTRQVTMQSLPSIRLVQENDKALVTRIHSTLVNTVPLWETQLAQSVTIQRGAEAARAVKSATDLTNDLLTRNAENLRSANAAIRTEMERGVFDIGAVRQANAALIATIEDSLRIADEGRSRRRAAEDELVRLEGDLRGALAAASAPGAPPMPGQTG